MHGRRRAVREGGVVIMKEITTYGHVEGKIRDVTKRVLAEGGGGVIGYRGRDALVHHNIRGACTAPRRRFNAMHTKRHHPGIG